jgi:hypothetical protein
MILLFLQARSQCDQGIPGSRDQAAWQSTFGLYGVGQTHGFDFFANLIASGFRMY